MPDIALLLAQLGGAETALYRLLTQQRKTQKRVNALTYNVIPRYQNTIRHIERCCQKKNATRCSS